MTETEATQLAKRIYAFWPQCAIPTKAWIETFVDFRHEQMTEAIKNLARKQDYSPSIALVLAEYNGLNPPPPSHVPRTPAGDVVLAPTNELAERPTDHFVDPRNIIPDDPTRDQVGRRLGLLHTAALREQMIAQAAKARPHKHRDHLAKRSPDEFGEAS